jgi:transglutaminase-like putative cysteine protease
MTALEPFLRATDVVDWEQPEVLAVARELARGRVNQVDVARACFEWVRDDVPHTVDHRLDTVTCAAPHVLKERTGFCYAKSHLLAALLRVNGIPAGFVYQRLALDDCGTTFCLHGLHAVWLPDVGWYRIDPRGNREGLRAEFNPPQEVLPFPCVAPGERVFPGVWPDPLPAVIDALQRYRTRAELEANLPDAIELDLPPDAIPT